MSDDTSAFGDDPGYGWRNLFQPFDPTKPPPSATPLGPVPAPSPFSQVLVHMAMGGDPADLPPEYQHIVPHVSSLLQPDPPLGPGVLGDIRHFAAMSAPAGQGMPTLVGMVDNQEGDEGDDADPEDGGEGQSTAEGDGPDVPANPMAPVGSLDTTPSNPVYTPLRGHQLGDLSMQAETGFGPGHEIQAAGSVSSGKGRNGQPDSGGVSYGAFQLSSKKGALRDFLKSPEGKPWASELQATDTTSPTGQFAQAWKSVAARDGQSFFDAQKQFIKRTHYDPVVSAISRSTGIDINSRSPAVQDAVWSAAVQHGAAGTRNWAPDAIQDIDPTISSSDTDYDRALINNLYDERLRRNAQDGERYFRERDQAMQGLSRW